MRPVVAGLLVLVAACSGSGATPPDVRPPTTQPPVQPQPVGSVVALQARIDSAKAGDVIVVEDGAYSTSAYITVRAAGTKEKPIRIQAKTIGGVTISGTHGFDVVSPATHVIIDGFVLTHASGRNQIRNGATNIRFVHNVFESSGDGAYITIAGDDAEIAYNELRNKKTVGNMIDVRGAGSQIAQRVWIHHNYFHDFSSAGENGAETIRFGLSGLSMSKGLGIIEHNLFVRSVGENEMLSIKSGSNIIRYNTLLDSPGAQLTLRHGNENLVYGNYFKATDGIRIFGDRHRVFSNYLEANSGGINIGNGGGEVADGAPLTSHDRPDDNVISYNTLVNNGRNYYMTARTDGLGARNTTFVNNVIVGGGSAASLTGPYTGGVWGGNIVWQTNGLGALPASGLDAVDPMLSLDASGIFRPRTGSPTIDSGVSMGDEAAVTVDMDGQTRTGRKDRGADEVMTGPATAKPLTVDEMMRLIRTRQ